MTCGRSHAAILTELAETKEALALARSMNEDSVSRAWKERAEQAEEALGHERTSYEQLLQRATLAYSVADHERKDLRARIQTLEQENAALRAGDEVWADLMEGDEP
jgi:hypothetical protein